MDVGSVQVTVTPFVDRGAGTVPTLEDDPLFEEERQASNNALTEFLREGAPATPGDVSSESESESSFVSPPRRLSSAAAAAPAPGSVQWEQGQMGLGGTNAAGGGDVEMAAALLRNDGVEAGRCLAGYVRTRDQMGATSLPSSPGRGKRQATNPG
jgi:hypothetical protein